MNQAHEDDISQILILNKKSIANYEQQLFQSELEKYRPYQNRLVQATHKQAALLKELRAKLNNLLQDKRVRSEQSKYESIQRQRASAINKYKRAYQEFLDLQAGLQSAKRWYSEMKQTVESLEKNVETFVNNRRSEGAQLLTQIEQERAANKSAHAALEQERLRGLMERMSMEPPSASPKPSGSSHPTPTPLSFNSPSTTYPKMNFAGQYQVPSSPPPNQPSNPQPFMQTTTQGYNQPSYNPSSLGRIPGPASPPPTQSTFGIGTMRPGPASPPPTQTSFSHNARPFSTYGNPAAAPMQQQQSPPPQQQQQQQNYVPPGFVPPPPPPGPPPLGPQQTFHYKSSDYYNMNPHERPTSSQQQHQQQPQQQQQQHAQSSADPWAGLNAWR